MDLLDVENWTEDQRKQALEGLHAALARRRLRHFVEFAWNWIEPREYRHNWHIDAICEHLEAVTRGEIKRLLINIPPRCGKSLIFAVFWPVWTWLQDVIYGDDGEQIPTCGPGARFLYASYSERLSLRDSLRCRTIIKHPNFKRHYPDLRTNRYQDTKIRFDIEGGGYRVATSVGGLATGEGGDIIGVDDPHNVKQAESDTVREETVRWFAEVLPTRFNDPKRGALAVIMQRVHERDVSGFILEKDLGYTHLCLPMRYERNHPFVCPADIRTEEGELLWPDHMGEAEVANIEKPLGSYQAAGQLQQRPAPREGGMFQRHWFKIVTELPERRVAVRAWDIAGSVSKYDPDWTVGVLMSRCDQGYFWIEDVVRFRATSHEVDRQMRACALLDGKKTRVTVPQDPGVAGKNHAQHMIRNLAGFYVKAIRPTGEKEVRARAFAAQCEVGNVRLLRAPWNNEFLNELCSFPNGRFDDQVDAASDAFNELAEVAPRVGSLPMRW